MKIETQGGWPGFCVADEAHGFVEELERLVVGIFKSESETMAYDLPRHRVPGWGPVIWIETDPMLDTARISKQCWQLALNPKRVLRSIRRHRVVTIEQLIQAMDHVPGTAVNEGRERTPMVIMPDLMGLFYDATLREGEVVRLWRDFEKALCRLKQRAMVVASTGPHHIPYDRQAFVNRLMQWSHVNLDFEEITSARRPDQLALTIA